MVDAPGLGPGVERREGSTPSSPTESNGALFVRPGWLELVDTADSKSAAPKRREGSSPSPGTTM